MRPQKSARYRSVEKLLAAGPAASHPSRPRRAALSASSAPGGWGAPRRVTRCLPILMIGGMVAGATLAHADAPRDALRVVQDLAIQHNGRVKPFDSFAREVLQQIAGSSRFGAAHPVDTVLSILADPERWQTQAIIHVPFRPLREQLGMNLNTTHISYDELLGTRRLMRMLPVIVAKQEREEKLSMLENETMDVFQRFVAFSQLAEHRLELVPPPPGPQPVWRPILQAEGYPQERQEAFGRAWDECLAAARSVPPHAASTSCASLVELLRAANPSAYPPTWRIRLEVTYNTLAPFRVATGVYVLATLVLIAGVVWSNRPILRPVGGGLLLAALAVHGFGILARVVVGGRPPVSNFFETMLWLPFVAVVLAVVFERVYRAGFFGLAAAIVAALTLALSEVVPLDSSISPVVAVLRSNLWLTVHVLTIVASYGALALATTLAHVYGILYLVRRGSHPALPSLDLFLYRTIQVGVVLLAGGVMLGAVWANASWGRYWGWDPKETWALITLLWFLAILHGRFAGWLQGIGVALSTIAGFFLLLMTYYGVSFYLVGLHSYAGGHAKPLPPLLVAYLIAEAAFIAFVSLVALQRKRPASE